MSIEITGDRTNEKEWSQPRITWGPIPTPRAQHFAFALDHLMYVIGGDVSSRVTNEDALIFCLDTSRMLWSSLITTGALPPVDNVKRFTCAVDKTAKKLYHLDATLNATGHIQRITLHTLDINTLTWTSSATTGGALPLTLNECAIGLANNKLYVYGGMELAGTYHNSLKYLDLASLSWTAGATYDCPIARANSSFAMIGTNLFIWGGRSYSTAQPYPLPSLYVYDTVANRWRDTRPKGTPFLQREGAAAVAVDNCLMFFGGYNSRSLSADNYYTSDLGIIDTGGSRATDTTFNPQWLSFTTANSHWAPKKRQGASAVYINGLIYFFGGECNTADFRNDVSVLKLSKNASVGTNMVESTIAAKLSPPLPSSTSSEPAGPAQPDPLADKISEIEKNADLKSRLLWALNNQNTFPDVEFKFKSGKTVYAHKVILAARSIVFRRKYDPTAANKSRRNDDDGAGEVSQSHLDISAESAMGSSPARSPSGTNVGGGSPSLRKPNKGSGSIGVGKAVSPPKRHVRSPSDSDGDDANKTTDMEERSSSSPSFATTASTTPVVDVIQVSDDHDEKDLLTVLQYMYTGEVRLENADQAERVSAIGYEYLLDELMRLCRSKTFPVVHSEPEQSLSRFLRRMVGSTVGSDIFFVVKRKKLLSHRVILLLFSSAFRKMILEDPARRYIEVKDAPGVTITVETFVEFCRTLYCFFTSMPEHKDKQIDIAELLGIALTFKETKLVDLLATQQVVTNESVLTTYEVAKAHGLISLQKSCLTFILDNFSSIVKDKAVLDSWSDSFKKEVLELYRAACPNWLDLLWFAVQTGDNGLKDEALKELDDLLNIENVINVLVGAHSCGAKELRSKCVDFILQHAGNVQAVQRMQNFSDTSITKVSMLSNSLNAEMHQKVVNQVSADGAGLSKSKLCTICFKEFSFFTNKKNSCTLCKRAACKDCILPNFTIPAVFGFTKPKPICKNCHQMVVLFQ